MHQHDTAFDRVADGRIRPKDKLRAIASSKMTEFRQIGKIHLLKWVIDTGHRHRFAWSAQCDRESKSRHKNCNSNKDGDENTLHTIGLTRKS